jgi:peptidoglycan/LPS O-acetylase OafA/YrhL
MKAFASTSATPQPASEQDRLGSIALDQWRGLALVLVLISHGFYFTDRVNGLGRVGVNLFFFISGILVFRSLSRTRAATAWERSRSFWWRRFRRLYPAMITYTLAMMPVAWLLQHQPNLPPGSDFTSYLKGVPVTLVYGVNYFETPMSLGHLWSLACEMQFYLLAPVIYLLGGKTDRHRHLVFGFLLVVLLGLGLAQPFIGKWKYHFEFAVWPMMLGFCCEYKRAWFLRISKSFATWVIWLGSGICYLSFWTEPFGLEMKSLVVASGVFLLPPCLMAYLFGHPMPGIAGPGITGRWMKWMGERTYSIYLWQQPFTLCNFLPNVLHPAGALVSVAIGGVWFHFFERPFLSASRRK